MTSVDAFNSTPEKLAPLFGVRLNGVDLEALLASDAGVRHLQTLLDQHQLLVLPQQPVMPSRFEALARALGTLLPHGAYETVAEAPGLQVLESTAETPSKIEFWHTDMTFSTTPPPVTLLHSQVIPAEGGDTEWLSTTAAFEALSAPFKNMLRGLCAEHDFRHGFRESLAEPGGAERLAATIAANPPAQHPVVLKHPATGREAIYVNPLFTTRILQLHETESDALLAFLYAHLQQKVFRLRLRWAPQMMVLWDNRSTQHRPINDYFPAHRKLHRATLAALHSH